MASMTDVIFLLLIFFMITSTVVSPNSVKVLLPQGKNQTSTRPVARVVIDSDLNIYAAMGKDSERQVTADGLAAFMQECAAADGERYVALYADETVPYGEIVRVLDMANDNNLKMVLATRKPDAR